MFEAQHRAHSSKPQLPLTATPRRRGAKGAFDLGRAAPANARPRLDAPKAGGHTWAHLQVHALLPRCCVVRVSSATIRPLLMITRV
jgi:hypothetical protein